MSESLNDVAATAVAEDVPSLADFAEESGGAWPDGWYKAEIIEGYATAKGKVFTTSDGASQKGDSRNLRLCFKVTNSSGQERTMQESFNYRPSDFSPERLDFIKQARLEYANVKRWADTDAQRTSLAIAKLGAIEKALGFTLRTKDGGMVPDRAVGQKVDIRLTVDEDGYNKVSKFDKAGTKVKA